jgi:hypothetical protein
MWRRWVGLAAALCVLAALAPVTLARAALPRVPFGFVGMNVDQPVWPGQVDLSHQLDVMSQSGVDSVRAVIDWSQAQPYASFSQVPAGQQSQFVDVAGVPTNLTAEHGMTLLPVVMNAPAWDGRLFGGTVAMPRSPGPYAAFVRALVQRYGPHGSFWSQNPQIPRRPVEMWQIWNEPNVWAFWPQHPQPFYTGYIPLLRAARAAIKQADPRAEVVLAGLPNYSWINLREIIRHGGRNLFDVVDVHPYTLAPRGVITILGYVRQVLDRYGRRGVPLLAGELSWPSSEGQGAVNVGFDIGTTEAGQAKKLGAVMPLLARNRRWLGLAGFYYYDWAGQERRGAEAFDFSGLFRISLSTYQFTAKPAYYVFKADALAMEGCRWKGTLASECAR